MGSNLLRLRSFFSVPLQTALYQVEVSNFASIWQGVSEKIAKGKEKLKNRPLSALMVGYFLISQPILMVPRVLFYVILAPDSIFGLKSDLELVEVGEKQLFWSFLSFLSHFLAKFHIFKLL